MGISLAPQTALLKQIACLGPFAIQLNPIISIEATKLRLNS
jgi:hypothetical protein